MSTGTLTGNAVIADGRGGFSMETIEVETPGPGEVRVRMAAAGVCHTDHASMNWQGPLVMGHEGAGHVESLGAGVNHLSAGQPVLLNWAIPCGTCFQCTRGGDALCERTHELDVPRLGDSRAHHGATRLYGQPIERAFHLGTFSQHTVVRAEAVTPLPVDLPVDVACILGCAVMTGVGSAIHVAGIAAGDTAAVVGCGGVGLNVIQGARIAGASAIIAIDRVQSRLDHAYRMGATHGVLTRGDDVSHVRLIASVKAMTEGRGVDHAFEATGVPALALLPLQLARHGGNALQVSGAHGEATLPLPQLFWNKRYMAPLYGGCVPSRDFLRLFEWAAQGKLEVASLISHRYPMNQLDRAFDDMLNGRSSKGVLHIP
jgi:S-(hydroxymethyl)glutathione dehydrogenase / alcohol dehydrogenase